ncbi:type II toxin-antitoxin system Phd/YefM family antitoxin [Endozoicomonas ascidiicola]|uniref:type II toxin-antitoxin system Phd/YefM family antitoxin n=1 Tax=Endozoicomonas ascidiicola TaxID=1698521 RepID=UPI00082D6392|nr:type II toxin-antitoxin system Phd/YefM family antitoxin [Endozoicomonas ascidiicola]
MSMEQEPEQSGQGVTLTQLRKNIYQLVDEVIASGKPLTIERGGTLLKLGVVTAAASKLGNLKVRNTLLADDSGTVDSLEDAITHQWEPDNGFD